MGQRAPVWRMHSGAAGGRRHCVSPTGGYRYVCARVCVRGGSGGNIFGFIRKRVVLFRRGVPQLYQQAIFVSLRHFSALCFSSRFIHINLLSNPSSTRISRFRYSHFTLPTHSLPLTHLSHPLHSLSPPHHIHHTHPHPHAPVHQVALYTFAH